MVDVPSRSQRPNMRPRCHDGRGLCHLGSCVEEPLRTLLSLLPGLSGRSVAAAQSPRTQLLIWPAAGRPLASGGRSTPRAARWPSLPPPSPPRAFEVRLRRLTVWLGASGTGEPIATERGSNDRAGPLKHESHSQGTSPLKIETRAGGSGGGGALRPAAAGFSRRKHGRDAAAGARKPRCRRMQGTLPAPRGRTDGRCQRKVGKTVRRV